jgi:DNA polymerase III sliding clamp (beta) subunit (PCNA family)
VHVKISRDIIGLALRRVAPLHEKTLTPLSNAILLTASDGALSLDMTTWALGLHEQMAATVVTEGSVVVGSEGLAAAISAFPQEEITLSTTPTHCVVEQKRRKYSLPLKLVAPELITQGTTDVSPGPWESLEIGPQPLTEVLRQIGVVSRLPAVHADHVAVLGFFQLVGPLPDWRCEVVDAARGARIPLPVLTYRGTSPSPRSPIPTTAIRLFQAALRGHDESPVVMELSGDVVRLRAKQVVVRAALGAQAWPSFPEPQTLPLEEYPLRVIVDRMGFLDVVARMRELARADDLVYHTLNLSVAEGDFLVESSRFWKNQAQERLSAEVISASANVVVGLDLRLLSEGLRACVTERVCLFLSPAIERGIRPAVIEECPASPEDPKAHYLCMPVATPE